MLENQFNPTPLSQVEPCISLEDIQALQKQITQVKVAKEIQRYIVNLVSASRSSEHLSLGVSPRGTVALQKAAQALAFIEERDYVIPDDLKFIASAVLAHRVIPNGGTNTKVVIDRLLDTVAIEA